MEVVTRNRPKEANHMKIELHLEDSNPALHIDTALTPTVKDLVEHIERVADVDGRSVVELFLGEPLGTDDAIIVRDLHFRHPEVRAHRQCVTIYFEGEELQHKFPTKATWAQVHRLGCRKFNIAADACANLELHLHTIDGPVVNERKQIGQHNDCIEVWLVKPGSEPNGTRKY
jgi:hypothetical protein